MYRNPPNSTEINEEFTKWHNKFMFPFWKLPRKSLSCFFSVDKFKEGNRAWSSQRKRYTINAKKLQQQQKKH